MDRIIVTVCLFALATHNMSETWLHRSYKAMFDHVDKGAELGPMWSLRIAWDTLAFPLFASGLGVWCLFYA